MGLIPYNEMNYSKDLSSYNLHASSKDNFTRLLETIIAEVAIDRLKDSNDSSDKIFVNILRELDELKSKKSPDGTYKYRNHQLTQAQYLMLILKIEEYRKFYSKWLQIR